MAEWLGSKVQPAWSADRAAALRLGLARKASRRRALVPVAMVMLALVAALVRFHSTGAPERPQEAVAIPIRPGDSTVIPLAGGAEIAGRERAYTLHSGGARFVVTHDAARPFVVQAGDVVVEDVGTVFTVAYVGDDQVEISVQTGEVHVKHGGVSSDLGEGQRLTVAAHDPQPTTVRQPDPAPKKAAVAPVAANRDDVGALLLAADDARAAGRPADAVPYLQRVVREHPRDSRVGLAAFTLGRLLSDDLGRPRDAALAFAQARAAGGPMEQDALAREALAYSGAGDDARARTLAAEYLRLYPRGGRAKEMGRLTETE